MSRTNPASVRELPLSDKLPSSQLSVAEFLLFYFVYNLFLASAKTTQPMSISKSGQETEKF
jgi:hypothetical protein